MVVEITKSKKSRAKMYRNIEEHVEKINEAVEFVKSKIENIPNIAIILGTGLGGLAKELHLELEIDYHDIPHFPISTVESHRGKLLFGKLSDRPVMIMQGRFHYYEGYSMQRLTFPVRMMKFLGIDTLMISNACGSINPVIKAADLMIIDDHINLIGDNPLIGDNHESFGPRFPDMSRPYSPELIKIAEEIALQNHIKVHKGVYAAMSGPSLETRAEYRMLRLLGADVIGMSTVPENIVANQMGMRVFGISIITDECYPDALKPVNIQEIIETAGKAEPNLTKLVKMLVQQI